MIDRTIHLVVPGALAQRTGGYGYDRRLVAGLEARGREVVVHELAGRFPGADDAARAAAEVCLDAMASDALPVVDGLALPAFHGLAGRLPDPWVALVHHPLALETGLSAEQAHALFAIERDLLRAAGRVVVTSPRTRRDLAAYDVPPGRIAVVPPGTDPAPRARGSDGATVQLLCVGTVVPRKGHLVLLEALWALSDFDWCLTCVGSLERDPEHAHAVAELIRTLELGDRVALLGECDEVELDRRFDGADLFVLASFHEGYGMVLAEALARGLPVVASEAGAISDTVPRDAGVLVPPGDPSALASALRRVIGDAELRRSLGSGACRARRRLSTWAEAARRFAAELDGVASGAELRERVAPTA